MRVSHLIVISIKNAHSDEGELEKSALALYLKHGSKAESAVLVHYTYMGGAIRQTTGESPFKLGNSTEKSSADSDEEVEKEKENNFQGKTVGIYLVFHAEAEGSSIYTDSVTDFIRDNLSSQALPIVTKVSLIACNSAAAGVYKGNQMESIENYENKKLSEFPPGPMSQAPLMIKMMADLHRVKITPMLCGFDAPVYVGGGKEFNIKLKKNKQWGEKIPIHPIDLQLDKLNKETHPIAGRKLVHSRNKGVKMPLSTKDGASDTKKKGIKKVMLIKDGKITFDFEGWSSK